MTLTQNLLVFILLFPIIGISFLLSIPSRETRLIKFIALNFTCFSFISSLVLWGSFSKSIGSFQFLVKLAWFPTLTLNFTLGVDGISLFFILLTTLLIPLCILASWNTISHSLKEFLIAFLFLDFLLIGVFCVLDCACRRHRKAFYPRHTDWHCFFDSFLGSLLWICLVMLRYKKYYWFCFKQTLGVGVKEFKSIAKTFVSHP